MGTGNAAQQQVPSGSFDRAGLTRLDDYRRKLETRKEGRTRPFVQRERDRVRELKTMVLSKPDAATEIALLRAQVAELTSVVALQLSAMKRMQERQIVNTISPVQTQVLLSQEEWQNLGDLLRDPPAAPDWVLEALRDDE